ncbi:MAG: HD-GYP domain-containing protein [Rubripirellula sp.]
MTSLERTRTVKCKRVPLSTLKPGAVLMASIEDPMNRRVKLLTEGSQVTQEFIDRLRARRIDSVILSQRDIAVMNAFMPQGRRRNVPPAHAYVTSHDRNDYSEATDAFVKSADLSIPPIETPLVAEAGKSDDKTYSDELKLAWSRESNTQIAAVEEFFDDTMSTGGPDVTPLKETCEALLRRIQEDQDAFVCMSSTPYDSDYPSRHGIHMTGISLTIGVEMGLDHSHLMDLGLGCLIHDVGMKAVGLPMFDTKTTLSQSQLKRLSDHPVKAIEIAGSYGEVSERAKLVAYQIHERLDGSGYPRGHSAKEIDPLAKIAAVADSFVGMLANRKHRLAIQGYFVMTKLLDEVKHRKLDPQVVRALIRATSLYPLGSYVLLDNDCIGRVTRSGRDDYTLPTIEMWHKDHLNNEPAVVNLKEDSSINIVESMPAPRAA